MCDNTPPEERRDLIERLASMSIPQQTNNELDKRSCAQTQPKQTVSTTSAPIWPVLHEDALYGPAGEVVKTISPHTEADDTAILLQFHCAFGNMLGRNLYSLVGSQRHGLNLYVALVGDTSKARKGTSWAETKDVVRLSDERWCRKQIRSGLSSGEGLIEQLEGTDEKDDINDKRLLVVETEFASALKAMERHGNTLSPVIRQCWDLLDCVQTMARKKNAVSATDPFLSIIAHITLDELRKLLCETETFNGFANRFLFALVKRSKILPEGGRPPEDAMNQLAEHLATVVKGWRDIGTQRIGRSEQARKLWAEVYERLSEGKPGLLGAATSRAEAQVLRLSMNYAALDLSAYVREPHLKAALALWNYSEESARFIFGEATGDSVADTILRALAINDLARNEIREKVFQRNMAAPRIDYSLQALLKAGRISVRKEKTDGREAEVFSLIRG